MAVVVKTLLLDLLVESPEMILRIMFRIDMSRENLNLHVQTVPEPKIFPSHERTRVSAKGPEKNLTTGFVFSRKAAL